MRCARCDPAGVELVSRGTSNRTAATDDERSLASVAGCYPRGHVPEMAPGLRRGGVAAAFVVMTGLWWWIGQGLVSSNDGSHLALGRALVLRGETRIDPEESLTLWTDRAHRDGHVYSDRPPGTAFAALPALWIGDRLDPVLLRASIRRGEIVYMPATRPYVETYGIRRERNGGTGPPLSDLQGTAAMLTAQAAVVGALGLWAMLGWLRRKGVSVGAQVFAVVTLAAGTLWGPYSTSLFSHVTAGTALMSMVLALEGARRRWDRGEPRARWFDAVAGLAGGWAVATDYTLALAVVPLAALSAEPRRWAAIAAGVVPIGVATALYHHAAFGSMWAVGYDHHAAFTFARDRGSTFSGNPVEGLWTLLGLGRGAGVAAQSPILLLGIVGLVVAGRTRMLLALLPWLLVLALHRTPYGGSTLDHRYLVPAFPLLGLGLASIWEHSMQRSTRRWIFAGMLIVLAIVSAALVWDHFFDWREA